MGESRINPSEARAILWNQGIVHWLLHPGQKDLYDNYHACQEKILVWNCSRRFGKSWALCAIAIETCIRKPNALIKYCCAKQVDAKGIIRPLIRQIVQSCPKELRPVFKAYEKAYIFPNGSRIELSGLDGGRADSLRGGACDLAIVDEAGLVGDLKHIIRSIILPTTATTRGKIILASTPPVSFDHPYIYFVNKARIEGNLITKTVYENPNIPPDEFQKILDEYGSVDSVDFRREYMCEIIKDENKAVVPEFDGPMRTRICKEWPKPVFYDGYVAMDLGMKDLTVVLFAYFDFRNDKVVIEDEFVTNGQKFTTENLAKGIKQKEAEVYTDPVTKEQKPPYLRVSDNNLIVINDLYQDHGIHFLPTRKDDADAALNKMRMLIGQEKIIIHPRCKTLIAHLESATWNKHRTSYERSPDNGHYDAIDSLKYLIRNIQFNKNPYPANYGLSSQYDKFQQVKPTTHARESQFLQLMNIKKK